MGTIGKQSITASIITYIGFAIGGLTTILFLNSKFFSAEQYGLTRVLFDIAYTLFGLANLGTVSILYRFYPYYRDRLPNERRDLFGRMLIVAIIGFVVVAIALFLFKGLFIQKFQGKSPLLVDYYYLIFPFTFFFLIFSLLEAQAWNERAAVATTFFKELALRFFTLLGMVLFLVGWISFDQFMLFFSCLFGLLALGLYLYLKRKRGMVITIEKSIVTRRMWKKMIPYGVFVLLITFCSILGKTFDTILISSKKDTAAAGVFTFITYLTSLMEAPQRGLIAASIPVIAQAWKDKDMGRISRIYQKSAINMLLFSGFLYALVALNFRNAFAIFPFLNKEFLAGESVFLILGLSKVVELGTGVNSQIIVTSRYWRFDFISNVLLVMLLLPLNYLLISKYDLDGVALATLIAYLVFNLVRFVFIYVKFRMQPFSWRTLAGTGVMVTAFCVAHFVVHHSSPLVEMILQSGVFVVGAAVFLVWFRVSEDVNGGIDKMMRKWMGKV